MYESIVRVLLFTSLLLSPITSNTVMETLAFGNSFPDISFGNILYDLFHIQGDWMHPAILILFGISFIMSIFVGYLPKSSREVLDEYAKVVTLTLSATSWLILLFPYDSEITTTLGRLMKADLALMIIFQMYLFTTGILPIESLIVGPLGAVALTPSRYKLNTKSVTNCIIFITLLFPALYRENGRVQSSRELFLKFNSMEIYAFTQIMLTVFYLIIAHTPNFREGSTNYEMARRFISTFLFIACANHNVAAAWALTVN